MTQALQEPITKPEAPAEAPAIEHRVGEPFAATEIKEFQSADWKAAAMVAGLTVTIFTIGLIIYLVVFASALAGPP